MVSQEDRSGPGLARDSAIRDRIVGVVFDSCILEGSEHSEVRGKGKKPEKNNLSI